MDILPIIIFQSWLPFSLTMPACLFLEKDFLVNFSLSKVEIIDSCSKRQWKKKKKPQYVWNRYFNCGNVQPSEEFELTANSLWAHIKTHSKLILRPLI